MPATSDPEDLKLVTLARSARARNGAPEGAAVRDDMGRTYAASTVDLPSLRLTGNVGYLDSDILQLKQDYDNPSAGVGGKIVMGILIGLAFHFAGRLMSHVGLLNDWPAIISAGMPVVIVAAVAAWTLRRAEVR